MGGGLLPPGLSLSRDGVISGFTDPIFALEYQEIRLVDMILHRLMLLL
jgi:hypothetical protein